MKCTLTVQVLAFIMLITLYLIAMTFNWVVSRRNLVHVCVYISDYRHQEHHLKANFIYFYSISGPTPKILALITYARTHKVGM